MKKFLLTFFALMLIINPVYAEDDDSTPYMPYQEQPKQEVQPKTNTKKTPAKKKTVKKKASKKKTAPKKTVKKAAAPKSSSLMKGIELLQQERYELAKKYLLKAIQENRNDPSVWYWYGVWHERTGGFYQAQYFYSKAITIDPTFEPLSRVVYYPNDPDKTPLWDPKRPARVYPVETSSRGVTTVSPNAIDRRNYPQAPNDPELPKVPVYTPPEPGSNPFDGDSWAPGVYVPPTREEIQTDGELNPIYVPPSPQRITTDTTPVPSVDSRYLPSGEETFAEPSLSTEVAEQDRDRIIRADIPLYNPPKPGENRTPPKVAQTTTKSQTKKSVEKTQTQTKQQILVPTRVVRQSDKKKTSNVKAAPAPAPVKKQTQPKTQVKTQKRKTQTVSQDVRPKTQKKQPAKPSQPQTRKSQPEKPVQPVQKPQVKREVPERIQQAEQQESNRRQSEYLPPVGQFSPDPGTISSETMLPPAGQGTQD